MKPASFEYHDPRTLAEVLTLLARLDNVRLLAGGQSLMPMMNYRYVQPDHLIDLNRVAELTGIDESASAIRIGAMTRQVDIERSLLLRRRLPILAEALQHVGHRQTRNRGTIGGSLCHLDPSAELVAVAMLLDARMHVGSSAGERVVDCADWPQGYMTTALASNELLTAVSLSPWPEGHGWGFVEMARRHGDFAIVAAGAQLAFDPAGRVSRVAVVVAGCTESARRLRGVEAALVGRVLDADGCEQAAAEASAIDAFADPYVGVAYRQHVAGVMVGRALRCAAERAGHPVTEVRRRLAVHAT